MLTPPPGRRAVIVAGLRTPFAKAGTALRDATAGDLARHCTRELLYRTELSGSEVDEVIMGQVISSPLVSNIAREVSLLPQLPRTIPAYTLNRACASGAQAICNAADQIMAGHADVILAGGVDSLSDVPITAHPQGGADPRRRESRQVARASGSALFAQMRPRDLKPVAPAIAEPSTGESMGQSAEKMAKENHITREAQDDVALMSHQRAAAATSDGRIDRRDRAVVRRPEHGPGTHARDNLIRADTSLDALAKLKPVFDRRYGTVTAGNSSPLTDGASTTLIMAEEKARALGYRPLTAIRSYAVAAVDPGWQLLMGPAYAVPRRARARRHHLAAARPGRDSRGVCGAGAVQHPGVELAGVGEAARPARTGRRGRLEPSPT